MKYYQCGYLNQIITADPSGFEYHPGYKPGQRRERRLYDFGSSKCR